MMRIASPLLACLAGLAITSSRSAEANLVIGDNFSATPLAAVTHYRAQPPQTPNAAWLPLQPGVVPEPKNGAALELRFSVRNTSGAGKHLVLVSGEPRTDRVTFRLMRAGKHDVLAEAGDMLTRDRPPAFISAMFRFMLSPGETATLLITVSNSVEIATDFTLYAASEFASYAAAQYAMQGIFFGALLVLLLYYAAVYIATRTREIEAYLWYLSVITVFLLARTGLLYQLTAYRWAEFMNVAVTPLPALIYSAGIRFARAFLELKKGRLDTVMRAAQYLVLTPVPVAFVSRAVSREMCDWLTLIVSPGLMVVAATLWNATPKARLFLLAWCWPIIVSLAQYTGIDSSFAVRNTLLQGSMFIEFAFFAIFVGRDIRTKERERGWQRLRLRSMHEELEEARKVHATLLPAALPETKHLRVSVFYRPMSQLGGDYYDWIQPDENRLVMLVADVTGHGLPAALDAAVVRIAFQSSVVEAETAAGILDAMNRKFVQQNVDRCVSAVCIIYSLRDAAVQVALAGHPPAILISNNKALPIGENASLLGFSGKTNFTQSVERLVAGDRLFLATDGVYEMPENADTDDFEEFTAQLHAANSIDLAAQIERTIRIFDGKRKERQWDDVTLLGLEIL